MTSSTQPTASFNDLLAQIRQDYPMITFKRDTAFRWSSDSQTVYYAEELEDASWTLLHELGHMIRKHSGYRSDAALVRIEVEAWQTATEIAHRYGIQIDEDYIQDCIDSYRTWQHERSTCPTCTQTGLEQSAARYRCINCGATWRVSPSRFCRAYRKTK